MRFMWCFCGVSHGRNWVDSINIAYVISQICTTPAPSAPFLLHVKSSGATAMFLDKYTLLPIIMVQINLTKSEWDRKTEHALAGT
jgi:hypothetical protein